MRHWITLIPLGGKFTENDMVVITRGSLASYTSNLQEIGVCHESSGAAKQITVDFKGKLSKRFILVMYSEEQKVLRDFSKPVLHILTQEQCRNAILIQ